MAARALPMTALIQDRTTNELRQAARRLRHTARPIAEPRLWLKSVFAADRCGRRVAVDSARAVRFCLVAAVVRAETDLYGTTCETDVAPAWRVAMEGRKRFRTALELLGEAFNDVLVVHRPPPPPGPLAADERYLQALRVWAMVANDLPKTTFADVHRALELALAGVSAELRSRRTGAISAGAATAGRT